MRLPLIAAVVLFFTPALATATVMEEDLNEEGPYLHIFPCITHKRKRLWEKRLAIICKASPIQSTCINNSIFCGDGPFSYITITILILKVLCQDISANCCYF